jgi:hypothetical protein
MAPLDLPKGPEPRAGGTWNGGAAVLCDLGYLRSAVGAGGMLINAFIEGPGRLSHGWPLHCEDHSRHVVDEISRITCVVPGVLGVRKVVNIDSWQFRAWVDQVQID